MEKLSSLKIEIEGRARPLIIRYSAERGDEHVIVEQMEGFNDADVSEIVRDVASMPGEPAAEVAKVILSLVRGMFIDMRAPGLPPSSRLYRDGSF